MWQNKQTNKQIPPPHHTKLKPGKERKDRGIEGTRESVAGGDSIHTNTVAKWRQ